MYWIYSDSEDGEHERDQHGSEEVADVPESQIKAVNDEKKSESVKR